MFDLFFVLFGTIANSSCQRDFMLLTAFNALCSSIIMLPQLFLLRPQLLCGGFDILGRYCGDNSANFMAAKTFE